MKPCSSVKRGLNHANLSRHGYDWSANHRDQGVRNPIEEGQQGPNHIEPGTEQKKANRGRIEQFGSLHQQPSRSKAGGRRKNGGEVRAGHTLPEDVMEMTIGGAPRLNATGTGWVSVTPVSRAICSTQTKSSAAGEVVAQLRASPQSILRNQDGGEGISKSS